MLAEADAQARARAGAATAAAVDRFSTAISTSSVPALAAAMCRLAAPASSRHRA